LVARKMSPVLAVDADPNSCLDELLGVKVDKSVGGVREEARQIAGAGMAVGAAKQQLLEMKIAESLVEADDFDLIAMGRPEGPGCYCYANNVLKEVLRKIAESYPYIVIDNEAGLENLSRRIVSSVDLLVLVADPSRRGLNTAMRLFELAREMDVKYSKLAIVINRLRRSELPDGVDRLRQVTGADLIVALGDDEAIADIAEAGGRLSELPDDNPVLTGVGKLLDIL